MIDADEAARRIASFREQIPQTCFEPDPTLSNLCILDANHKGRHGWESKIQVGDILGRVVPQGDGTVFVDGFCGGEWGRDSYGIKRVEHVGEDYVVVRDADSGTVATYNGDPAYLAQYKLDKEKYASWF